jgi:hypothetical protein
MHLLSIFLVIFISCSAAYAGERPKEFQGLFWGTHISKVEGLQDSLIETAKQERER